MRTGSRLLLAFAVLGASAIAQEIVIEPTNGRAPTASHAAPRAAVQAAAVEEKKPVAKTDAKSEKPERSVSTKKKAALKQISRRSVRTVEASPSITATPVATSVASATPEASPAAKIPAAKTMPARPSWAMEDTRDARSLQVEIAEALARDPKLAGSSIQVNVDGGSVTLEGSAAGTDERLQAERLTQSYAWNRKLVNHIEIVRAVSAQK